MKNPLTHQKDFDPKKQKKSRIFAFDLGRGIAIFLMIVIHVLTFYASPEVQQGTFAKTLDFLLSWPSASLFIFLMGVLVAYSDSPNIFPGLRRSFSLFAVGYLLNLLRETVPTWLSLEMGLVTYEQLGKYTPINGLLVTDILQFAAVAFATCILLKHFMPRPQVWLSISLAIIFGSPFLWDIQSGIPALDHLLKLFWGNKEQGAIFPVFPWLAYPIIGMAFGYYFKYSNNQKKSFQYSLIAGFTLIALGCLITLTNIEYHTADHLRPGPGIILVITGVVFIFLWLCQLLINSFTANRCFELLFFWSKNVTAFYFIHWLYVGWGLILFGAEQLSLVNLLLWMITVAILSHFTLRAWLYLTQTKAKQESSTSQNSAVRYS